MGEVCPGCEMSYALRPERGEHIRQSVRIANVGNHRIVGEPLRRDERHTVNAEHHVTLPQQQAAQVSTNEA